MWQARPPLAAQGATGAAPTALPVPDEEVHDADVVVGALSSAIGLQTLEAVIEAKRDYVDISFMPEDNGHLSDLAKRKRVTAVVDMGVAPGMSNLLCGWAAHRQIGRAHV